MKFISKSLGYNWTDYKTNIEVLNELKITSTTEKMYINQTGQIM
jgi:hypothetical protein